MDMDSAIKLAVADGKAVYGARSSLALAKEGKAKAIVVASNAPDLELFLSLQNTKVYRYQGGSVGLGLLCGKPYAVSALAITDDGAASFLGE